MHKSEREFANFLESQGKTWIHHPKRFKFNDESYQTDFYCPEDDTYYEVKTHLGLGEAIRLLRFKKFHPGIKFKVVSPNGYPYYSRISSKCLEIIERKLDFIKSRDILEISLDEYQENLREFHILEKRENGSNLKSFHGGKETMRELDRVKQRLGLK